MHERLGLKGTIQQAATFETLTEIYKVLRPRFPSMGARRMATTIRQDYSIKVPEYVYKFISKEDSGCCPLNVPKFRYVDLALAMEGSPDGTKKQNGAVFLVEEVIAEEREGPFRKYLNNVSPVPLQRG